MAPPDRRFGHHVLWIIHDVEFQPQGGLLLDSLASANSGSRPGLFFVPLSAAAYFNIPMEQMGNASGIFNLVRNLGGGFGVAFSATLLSQRTQVHQTFLSERITPYNPAFQEAYQRARDFLHDESFGGRAIDGGLHSSTRRFCVRRACSRSTTLFMYFPSGRLFSSLLLYC